MSSEVAVEMHGGRWKRYPAYRDSGVGWLGVVPEEWGVKRVDAFTSIFRHPVSAESLSGREVFHYSIPIVQETGNGQLEDGGEIESNKTLISEQVLLVSKLNPRKGTIVLASPQQKITVCSGEFVPLVPRQCVPKYLEYVYRCEGVRQLLSSRVESVTRSHQRVNPTEIYKMFWSWPSLPEQRAIAAFLDRETGRIDTLVAKKERQIELLREKRAALISHAVTKGRDPDAPMEDSGVEWLGAVPEHWHVHRSKLLFREANDRSTTGEEMLLTVSHITGVTRRSEKNVTMFMAESLEGYKKCEAGDLVINTMWAWMGAMGIAPERGIVSPSYNVYRFRSEENEPSFYDYLFRTGQFVTEVICHSKGVWLSRLRLYPEAFFEIRIPCPSQREQREIVSFIQKETGNYETLQRKIEKSVEKLREYRTAIISAAVTGKIDVREELVS